MYANAGSWAANGFEIHEKLIDPTLLEQFNVEFEGLVQNILTRAGIETDNPLHDGVRALDELDHSWIHSIYNTVKGCDALHQIVFSGSLLDKVRAVFDVGSTEMISSTYSIVRMDPPEDPRFLYKWHQESFYSIPDTQSVQVWAPLVGRNTSEMGTMEVLVGSHKQEFGHHIEKVPGGHEQYYIDNKCLEQDYEGLVVEIDPGDVVLFHPFLIHKSRTNVSNKVRYSLTAHFINPLTDTYKMENIDYPDFHRRRTINYESYMKL